MIQHSEQVNFRASPDFTRALAVMAQREGVTRSELIRRAVSDRAALAAAPPPPINITVEANPAEGLHFRAAKGDGLAFAEMASLHYQQALNGFEPAPIALAKAIVFSRLAAVHPEGTRQDLVSLLFLLDQQAETLRAVGLTDLADRTHAEAVTIAEGMAEDGDEEIAQMIVSSAAQLTRASLNIARGMREAVKETVGC